MVKYLFNSFSLVLKRNPSFQELLLFSLYFHFFHLVAIFICFIHHSILLFYLSSWKQFIIKYFYQVTRLLSMLLKAFLI